MTTGNAPSTMKDLQGGVERAATRSGSEPPTLRQWATRDVIRKHSLAPPKKRSYETRESSGIDGPDSFERIQADAGAEIARVAATQFLNIMSNDPGRFKSFADLPSAYGLGLELPTERMLNFYPNNKLDDELLAQTKLKLAARDEAEEPAKYYSRKLQPTTEPENGPVVDILVSCFDIPRLKRVFPNIRIHRFESLEDFIALRSSMWSSNNFWMIRERTCNNEIVSTVGDTSLWEGAPLHTIDAVVIVHTYEPAGRALFSVPIITKLGKECASRMWVGGKKNYYGDFIEQGKRIEPGTFPADAVREVVLSTGGPEALDSLRLPLASDGHDPHYGPQRLVQDARSVAECWPYMNACGWIESDRAKIIIIEPNPNGPVAEIGTEWKQPLPLHHAELAKMIDTYGNDTSKLLVYDTKYSKYGSLHVEVTKADPNWYQEKMTTNEYIFASGAENVVFYCDHSSTSSPASAKNYYKWLRKTHPESRRKVYMLAHGLEGFMKWAKENDVVDKYMEISRRFRDI